MWITVEAGAFSRKVWRAGACTLCFGLFWFSESAQQERNGGEERDMTSKQLSLLQTVEIAGMHMLIYEQSHIPEEDLLAGAGTTSEWAAILNLCLVSLTS